jgi:hypothetical protein
MGYPEGTVNGIDRTVDSESLNNFQRLNNAPREFRLNSIDGCEVQYTNNGSSSTAPTITTDTSGC